MDITTEEFDATIATGLTLVDFWAPWCGPCKALTPVIDGLEEEYAGRAKIVKVNVDEEPELVQRFAIRGVPTLILFQDGNLHSTVQAQKSKIVSTLDEALGR